MTTPVAQLVACKTLKCTSCYYCRDASAFADNFQLHVDPVNGSDTENLGQSSSQPLATLEKALEELGRYHWRGEATVWVSGALTVSGADLVLPVPTAGQPGKIVVRGANPTTLAVTATTAAGTPAWVPGTTLTVNRYPQVVVSGTHTPGAYAGYSLTQTDAATGRDHLDVVYTNAGGSGNTLSVLNSAITVGAATLSTPVDQLALPAATATDFVDVVTNGQRLVFRDLVLSTGGLTIGSSVDSAEPVAYERCRFALTTAVTSGILHGRAVVRGCYSSVPGGRSTLVRDNATDELRIEHSWLTDTVLEVTGSAAGRRRDPRSVRFESVVVSGGAQQFVNVHNVDVFGASRLTTVATWPVQVTEVGAAAFKRSSVETNGIPSFSAMSVVDGTRCSVEECEISGSVANGISVSVGAQLVLLTGSTPTLFDDNTLITSAVELHDDGALVLENTSAASVSGGAFASALSINTGSEVRVSAANFGGAGTLTYDPDLAGATNAGATPFWPPVYPPANSVKFMSHP